MRIIVDMNLSTLWVDALAKGGHAVAHWATIGASDAPDTVIMDHAAQSGAVVLTRDLDFAAMLASSARTSPSVVQLRASRASPDVHGPIVLRVLNDTAAALSTGAIVTIDTDRVRVRVLPFKPLSIGE
jgi:predicted nuclease of predicted toxin-antitoxin system